MTKEEIVSYITQLEKERFEEMKLFERVFGAEHEAVVIATAEWRTVYTLMNKIRA